MASNTRTSDGLGSNEITELSVAFEATSLLDGDRLLIDNATGIVRAGRLCAIVSACGSRGDLLMLHILAGLDLPSSGTVVANCVPVSSTQYQESAAYIQTSSNITPAAGVELSVLDNLNYSLRMRRTSLGAADLRQRIDRVLWHLQMQHVTDKAVASLRPKDRVKLLIATELVMSPDFVFIDLDLDSLELPDMCDLLHVLGEICREERVVMAVALVQPRWLLLEYFHDVLLMEHSRLYYCGTREALLPLLHEAESFRPNSFSGADNLAAASTMLMDDDGRQQQQGQQQQVLLRHPESCLNALYIICASTRPADLLEPPGFAAARSRTATDVANQLRDTADGRIQMFVPRAANELSPPNFVVRLVFMFIYGLYRARQELVKLVLGFVIAFAAFLLLGHIYGNVINHDHTQLSNASETIQNSTGLLFFFVSLAFLYNLVFIERIRDDLQIFQQHRAQGYYSGGVFLTWLVLSNGSVRTVFCCLMILGLYIIDPLLGLSSLQHLIVVLGVVSFCSLSLAWAVLALFPTSKQLTVVVFVSTYAISALFGGLFINLLSLPVGLRRVSEISIIRLGFESVIVGQFSGRNLGCNVTAANFTTTTTTKAASSSSLQFELEAPEEPCMTGDAYIASVGFHNDNKWDNLWPVMYMFWVFMALAGVGIWYNRKFSAR